LHKEDEVFQDQRVGQLFDEHGSDADGDMKRYPLFFQIIQSVQEWEIGLGGGFVKPLLTVRPSPRHAAIGQVAV